MYTKISAEFESVDFAEVAAKYIKEQINGKKKIVISQNRTKFNEISDSKIKYPATSKNNMVFFPFSTHSNNYMSGMVIRDDDRLQENELLATKSAKMEIICDEASKERVVQFIHSYGGYDIKN